MRVIRFLPAKCRKPIRILTEMTGMDEDTAYAMMLMTAALMDLRPEDGRVLEMILQDCGLSADIA